MITLEEVSDTEGFKVVCPHCGTPLRSVGAHDEKRLREGDWLANADILPEGDFLTMEQKSGVSWQFWVSRAKWDCCDRGYVVVLLTMAREKSDGDRVEGPLGPLTNLVARRGNQEWLVRRYDSEQGPVFEHMVGSWVGPDADDCVSDYVKKVVSELADDLRELTLRS